MSEVHVSLYISESLIRNPDHPHWVARVRQGEVVLPIGLSSFMYMQMQELVPLFSRKQQMALALSRHLK